MDIDQILFSMVKKNLKKHFWNKKMGEGSPRSSRKKHSNLIVWPKIVYPID